MIDYESPEAKAALKIAMLRPIKGLGQGHVVDFILLSKGSLWYKQAQRWSEQPPEACSDEGTRYVWKRACEIIVQTVEHGYNAETGKWWDRGAKLTQEQLFEEVVILSDFGVMLEQYRRSTFEIISQGFETFIEIMNGKEWKKKYHKLKKELEKLGQKKA